MLPNYYRHDTGVPPQSQLLTGRAVVTPAYTVIPRGVISDIVASLIPGWSRTRAWILARPIEGFSTTFAQYLMEVAPGGGSDVPENDRGVECVIFVLEGTLELRIGGERHHLEAGGYVYMPPATEWAIANESKQATRFLWIRKRYEPVAGHDPQVIITSDQEVEPDPMPETDGAWATSRFVDPSDLAHDMHVNIVTFEAGAVIPFAETHVMEHGIYILEGKGVYRLNDDWVEVEAGDFLWLRAFCPQACYAGGPGKFRYLLYKDVNRQIRL